MSQILSETFARDHPEAEPQRRAHESGQRILPGHEPQLYVDRAPHLTADAGLTLAGWRGWSGSLRLRVINHYRLDPEDPTILAAGSTVIDLGVSRRLRRGVEFTVAIDNLANREKGMRLLVVFCGLTFRLGGK